MKKSFFKKVGRYLYALLGIAVYIGGVYLIFKIPGFINNILIKINVAEDKITVIKSIIIVTLSFIISSKTVYMWAHKILSKEIKKENILYAVYVGLITLNDYIIAIPKRTFLYLSYIGMIIASRLGHNIAGNYDWEIMAVLVMTIDSLQNYFKDEMKTIKAYGQKAYDNNTEITESLVEK